MTEIKKLQFQQPKPSSSPNPSSGTELEDPSQRDKPYINTKLIPSLQESLRHFMQCLMSNNIDTELLNEVLMRRHKDKFVDRTEVKIEVDKEQYSSLLYFRMESQLKCFPSSISGRILEMIGERYRQMLDDNCVNVIEYYQFIRATIYTEIDHSLNLSHMLKIDESNKNNTTNNGNVRVKKGTFEDRLQQINDYMQSMYKGMELDELYFLDYGWQTKNFEFQMAEHQHRRNEKILKKIVQFSTKIKKIVSRTPQRALRRIDEVKNRASPQFKIRKSYSFQRNKSNQNKNYKKFLFANRVYFKQSPPKAQLRLKL